MPLEHYLNGEKRKKKKNLESYFVCEPLDLMMFRGQTCVLYCDPRVIKISWMILF